MPRVMRREPSYGEYRNVKRYVPFSEFTADDRRNFLKEKVVQGMGTILGINVLIASWMALGNGGERSPEAAAEGMREGAAATYLAHSTRQKFEDMYITPIEQRGDYLVNSHGFRGELKHVFTESYESTFGQMCLRGSGYDTTPSNIRTWGGGGDISAVASLSQTGNDVSVYPAGSNAPSLQFTLVNGELIPDDATAMTLTANSCEPTSGLLPKANSETYLNEYTKVPGFLDTLHPGQEQ